MAWENKPLSNYTEGPWGKTIVIDAEKPSPGNDGFAQLMQVQYDPNTGKRLDDQLIFWNVRDLKQHKKALQDELDVVNAKLDHVQAYLQAMPEPEQLPAPGAGTLPA